MRILVTGTEGYLGCLLAPRLLDLGHDVLAIDTGYYRHGWLYSGVRSAPQTLLKDIRHISAADLEGVDAVIHLAELSNDPLGELVADVTREINHHGTVRLAHLAKEAGVQRFIYASSCSVYGVADGTVDEQSPLNPQTAYAQCKVLSERDLLSLADDGFSPTSLRNATAFGASPRLRFDIVLNNLAGLAHTTGNIAMTSDGTPWRPLVHAADIGTAILCALEAPLEDVAGEVFNVGSNEQNCQVRDIALAVQESYPHCTVSFGARASDNRSYRVNFDKIANELPGFKCDWDAASGVRQLKVVFDAVDLDVETFLGARPLPAQAIAVSDADGPARCVALLERDSSLASGPASRHIHLSARLIWTDQSCESNRLLREIKRSGHGFRNVQNYWLRLL